jgi:hypothetical protein
VAQPQVDRTTSSQIARRNSIFRNSSFAMADSDSEAFESADEEVEEKKSKKGK